MICFWHNNALCLSPEDDKELEALSTVYYAFRAGLKARPEESLPGYTQSKCQSEEPKSL